MLIRHLYYFIKLAEEKHFGRAAKACNIAQPTLSAAIRKLEEDLSAALIVRGHRFLGLTPEGEKALEWGRQILLDYESLQKDLKGNSGLTGTMRLGVIPAAMPSVSVLSERVVANDPGVTIEIRSLTSRAIQVGLDTFEIDGGLTYLENEPLSNIRTIPLYRERYVFICRARHRFAARKSLGWQEAVSEPLCLLSDDMQNRRILDGIARAAGISIRPQVVSNSFLAVAAHVKSGSWCSIVPHTFFLLFGGDPDLVMIELKEPSQTQSLGLVLSDRTPQSPMASALIAAIAGFDMEAKFRNGKRKK